MKRIAIIAAAILTAAGAVHAALSVGNGVGATNITATSAWLQAVCITTGAARPGVTVYYGQTNGGTSVTSWATSNAFGGMSAGTTSFQATGLSAGTIYYSRVRGTNASETNWAYYTVAWRTLDSGTTAPSPSVIGVTCDTDGLLKAPLTFFSRNSTEITSIARGAFGIDVAWSSNGAAGSTVIVTNVGSLTNASFGFIIPVGSNGANGADGEITNGAVWSGFAATQNVDMGGFEITNCATLDALGTATQALDGRVTAVDAADTGTVAVLVAASNALNTRVATLEGLPSATNWAAYPAAQNVDFAGYTISNVTEISSVENGVVVLTETFDTDPFPDRWTNDGDAWDYNVGYISATAPGAWSTCLVANVESGHRYRAVYQITAPTTTMLFSAGGVVFTNETGTHTNDYDGDGANNPAFASSGTDGSVFGITITDITPSNDVTIARVASDRVTLGGVARTNWPDTDPFQAYTATVNPGDGETATVAYAHGSLVKIVATNGLTTLTFDPSAYPTAGVSRVAVNLWADTNSIGFDSATITNATAPTIPTNAWKGLLFRRIEGGLWHGREY